MATLTAKYKPYPVYKPSGSEWLRDLPAHWEVQRLRHASEMRVSNVDKHTKEYESPVRLCNYVDVYNNEYITERIEFMSATATLAEIGRFRLEVGDVLITKDSEKWDDIGVPALVQHAADDLICGYHLALLRSSKSKLEGGYLLRAMQSPVVSSQFHVEAKGVTRYGLTHDSIRSIQLPIPPISEQRAITAFLDRETAKIDTLISKKERLIELLQEKRTALISHTVTKGLNPNAPKKDSGVEWLREIPMHWEVKRLKHLGNLQGGAGFPHEVQGDTTQNYPFFKVGDMGVEANHRDMVKYQHTVSSDTARRLGAHILQPSTIVFAKVGAALMLNRRRMIVRPSCIDNNLMGFIPRVPYPDWMLYWLSELDLSKLANPGAVPSVNEGQIREHEVFLPPPAEQRAIADFLDRETDKLDNLVDKVHRAIELLTELRTALISAAVTGKIDVREEMECT